jgi:hypothetical protein
MRAFGRMAIFLTVLLAVGGGSSAFADGCDSVGDNSIEEANIANLRQMADNAEQQAGFARTDGDRQRWLAQAQLFRSQADSQERTMQTLANGARQICHTLSDGNGDSNGSN